MLLKMKTPRQIKVITSQLEVLEELKEQLETFIADINTVTLKGKTWIDDSDSQNFVEINLYLSNETSRCLRRYRDLNSDDFDQHSYPVEHSNQVENTSPKACNLSCKDDKTYQRLAGMMDTIESTLAKHSRKIKNLQQKSLGHETRIQSTLLQIQENETQYNSKFEEFIKEFQGASQFMSSLQTQNTTLSNKVMENEEQIIEMVNTTETLRHLPQEVEYQKERLESFVQANESEDKGHVLKMDEVMQEHTSNIQQLNTKYEHLLNLIQTNENEIRQIQTCNATETLSHIKQKLTKHEEDLERIEINHKEMSDTNRKKMDDINAKLQAHSETTSNLQINFESLQSQLNNLKDDFKHTDSLTESLKTNMTEIKDQLSNYKSDSQILNLESSFFEVTSELYKELDVVKNKMSTVESQVLNLSGGYAELLKISSQDVTVACRLWIRNSEEIHLNKDTIVTCFNGHDLNIGKCYNKTTGIFTAPCKGLYLCSLMMGSEDWARFNIHVRKNGRESVRGTTHTNSTGAVACLVTVLELDQGDEVYIKPANDVAKIKINIFSYFVVVLLQQNRLEHL
ncbi:myosin-16-like [Biomphalaria glabrata]|uniref:Myosin-16-like n=1 Tax=Biomphalaria glabrata TaxID=6526 RepID=A0A9W2ZKW0_BIOGL|nr:myosin-16-like [Biomphalaria glabrata]